MLRIDPVVDMMFTEQLSEERFAAAAAAGSTRVKCIAPFEVDKDELASVLCERSLALIMFNGPSGDLAKHELVLAAVPGREAEFQTAIDQAISNASATSCDHFNGTKGSRST